MKVTRNDEKTLDDIHRKFSEIAGLFESLSNETKVKTLQFHNENFSINHCIRWGEIGISEVINELE